MSGTGVLILQTFIYYYQDYTTGLMHGRRYSPAMQKLARVVLFLVLNVFTIQYLAAPAAAQDVTINLSVEANQAGEVVVTVSNSGAVAVTNPTIEVSLQNERYSAIPAKSLVPGETTRATIKVSPPTTSGTYALVTTLRYALENTTLSLQNVTEYRISNSTPSPSPADIAVNCPTAPIEMDSATIFSAPKAENIQTRLILPDEISATIYREGQGTIEYLLRSNLPYRNIAADAFLLYEAPSSLKRCQLRLTSNGALRPIELFVFPYRYHLLFALLGFLASILLYRQASRGVAFGFTPWTIALMRWTFSFATVACLFLAYEGVRDSSAYLLWKLPDYAIATGGKLGRFILGFGPALEWLGFNNGDYNFFNIYVAEPLYLYMLTANLFVLRFLIHPDPAKEKYWHLMLKLFHLIPGLRYVSGPGGKTPCDYDRRAAHIAILALCLKCFYLPVFSSWTISNFSHMMELWDKPPTAYLDIVKAFVDLLIFIDVAIFLFGYFVELPALKNVIRSVEPTLFGWLICLICYPPLNRWALLPLDKATFDLGPVCGALCLPLIATITAILWFIYVWASVALGFKASNLTNRGIVMHGPYRFVRHPAYISKVLVWLLASLFFGTMNVLFVVILFVIYSLRAWTEERHLSQDPDYAIYRAKVRWIYIPGIF